MCSPDPAGFLPASHATPGKGARRVRRGQAIRAALVRSALMFATVTGASPWQAEIRQAGKVADPAKALAKSPTLTEFNQIGRAHV